MTAKLTPHEIGAHLEKKAGRYLQGIQVVQSGGGKFWKLDVAAGNFLLSCKATLNNGIRVTSDMLHECRRAARGLQGRGDRFVPGLLLEIEGEDEPWIAFPMSVAGDLLTKDPEADLRPHMSPSKGKQRLAAIDRGPRG